MRCTLTPASPRGRGARAARHRVVRGVFGRAEPSSPAILPFCEPSPLPLSQWERSREKGDRQAGLRVRSLVLVPRLRAALERLNPALPPEVITTAVDELSKLWRGPGGRAEGYGLRCFPEKNEGPPGSPSSPSPNG